MLRNSKFKTFIWYTGVGVLVFIAVAVSLFRLYFASADEYRGKLEAVAGSYLGQPVTISGMDVRLVGLAPSVILSDVALLHKGGERLLTRFDEIAIALDPLASLFDFSPIIELSVSGANLEVSRNADNTFGVQGLQLPGQEETPADETKGDEGRAGLALANWFLSQTRLALRNSHITLHDRDSGERFSFDNVELELRNDGERHRLNGFVHLPKSIGRELRVSADIEGNLLQGSEWGGAFYVRTERLQPQQWLQQLNWKGSSLRNGILDLELWSRWQGGRLESLTTRLQAADLLLARDGQSQAFPQLSADARLLREGAGWQLDIANLQLQHNDEAALPMRWQLALDNGEASLRADRLQLESLAALLPYLPALDKRQQEMVRQMAPAGLVEDLAFSMSLEKEITVQGTVQGLALQPWEKLPGVSGLNGRFGFQGGSGRLQLSSAGGELRLPRLFRAPLSLSSLDAELRLRREADGWRLLGDSISLQNEELSAQLALELQLAAGSAPWLSLQGRFQAADARAVPHYLPARIMKEKSLYWLDHAFKAGRVPRGTLQYHGYTSDFPFRARQGRFEVLFDAEAVQLHYRDDWPDLQQLAGEVHFDGLSMEIAASGARLFDARLRPATVTIDNFKAARLLVDGGARFPINDGLRFLRESPLSRHSGKVLETMQGEGEATLALQLAIPLSAKLYETMPLSVNGKVEFGDNRLDVIDGVTLQRLNGTLHFTEKSFTAEQLNAQLFGKPATIVVASDGEKRSKVVVAARGGGSAEALREAFDLPLLDYLNGELEWQASLTLPRGVAAEGVELHISSNLVGLGSELPVPLAKQAESSRDMRLSFYLTGLRSGEVRLTLQDLLGLAWRQGGSGDERRLRRAQLRLGGSEPLELPQRDVIEVVGQGGELNFARWRELLRKLRGERTTAAATPPLPVAITLQQLQLLSEPSAATAGEALQLRDVPAVSFAVEQFAYDDLALGKVAVKLVPQEQKLAFREISITSDLFAVSGDGTWSEGGNTFFNLNLFSPDLGGMMRHLGFATVIQGGETTAKGKVWWTGSPMAVSLAGLNSELALQINKGRIIDVEPGAGRMLGILSLPALPRRLSLDFSDVFDKGLAFDQIKGDIRIEEGQAYTSNLRLESAPANILISGRTGLVAQDFDQQIYVVPNVSGTVSVASALAWGPQVAAVVALLQELFKSDIKAVTMNRYHLSGSWRAPVIRRLVEQPEGQEEPPFYE